MPIVINFLGSKHTQHSNFADKTVKKSGDTLDLKILDNAVHDDGLQKCQDVMLTRTNANTMIYCKQIHVPYSMHTREQDLLLVSCKLYLCISVQQWHYCL